jgi:spore coat protein H
MKIVRFRPVAVLAAPCALLITLLAPWERSAVAEQSGPESEALDHPFVGDVVWPIHIELSAEEFAAMQPRGQGGFFGFGRRPVAAPPAAATDDDRELHRNTFGVELPWATGAITIDGQRFANVGLRYKGNGTIMDARESIKKSIKVELDHFGGAEKFLGQKTINLHCGVTDPTKSRETLAYGLYRKAGVPASRTALAEVRLTVPGKFDNELLGVYTMVEHVGDKFLRERFATDEGLLMKPEGIRDFDDMGAYWPAYEPRYLPKREATDAEAQRLIALTELIHDAEDDEFEQEIRGFLDVDAYLRFLAVTAYLANSDSFFVLGHNYNLYLHPTTQQFHFIPWDLDRAFANFFILGSYEQQMDLSMTHPYPGTHRLTERLLAIEDVQDRYQVILRELAAECFAPEPLLAEVAALEEATRELIVSEQRAATDRGEGRTEGRDAGFGPPAMFGAPPDLREFIETRMESVAAQLAGTSTGHVPTGGWGPPGGPGGPGGGPPGFGGPRRP